MSAADIAAIFGITPRAVLQWVATFINCGQNGLVANKVSGSPPKLNAEQLRRLAFLLREHCPNKLLFDFGLLKLRLIA